MNIARLALPCFALAILTRCATMMGAGPERITVRSDPEGADVTVRCAGEVVGTGVTPAAVAVPRVESDCLVTIAKEGFAPREVVLESGLNPRFWLNLPMTFGLPVSLVYVVFVPGGTTDGAIAGLALGAAGMAGMIIDSVTDAKRDHDPKTVTVTLTPSPP